VFGLLSPTPTAFRIGVGSLYLLVILTVAWTARLAFGPRAGFFAGLYLALGPAFFLYKGLTSDGAYVSLLLLLGLCLALLLRIESRLEEGLAVWPEMALLGVFSGLAWWVHPIALAIGPVALVSCLLGRTRRFLAPRHLCALAGGFLVGAFPWLWHNARHGWPSLHASEMSPAGAGKVASAVLELFWQGLPRLLGGRPVWRRTPTFPGSPLVALLLFALLIACAVLLVRRPRAEPPDDSAAASAESAAGSPLSRHAAALYLTLLLFLPLLCLSVARTNFKEPRYLLPLYLALAPLAGALLDRLWSRRALLLGFAAVLLALGPGSELRAPRLAQWEMGHFEADPGRLLDGLAARGVREIYASYWAAYRLAFLSGGRLAASPFGSGDSGLVRDAALRERLDSAPAPAFLLCCEDLNRFAAFLARHGIAHQVSTVEGFSLYTGLPPDALARLRSCYCIPESPSPGAVVWRSIEGPRRLSAHQKGVYRVAFANRGKEPLSSNVHLSYHWRRLDGGNVLFEGARTLLSPPADDWWKHPWREVTVEARVEGKVPPGEYALVFDFVDENVSWFESYGLPTASYRVVVQPAS
ncbi:MAG TPA: hypothetical protein VMM92_05975, partial [Thermoanaerobaculia bacterium]|nr:hypothetical protein [Thermoanaerobaculia bacterium]